MKKLFRFFLLTMLVLLNSSGSTAQSREKTTLSIHVSAPGSVRLDGDISVNDRIRLWSREYRSADHTITDRLLAETTAEADDSVSLTYNLYAAPVSEEVITPDFSYEGREIVIKALYAVVSDDNSQVRSDLIYTDCTLDTGVVNQYWCSLAGSTAFGTAAGVTAMQIAYPSSGDGLFTRLNVMRKYSLIGEEFSTGPSEYYLCGDHINNAVNKYVSEELSEGLIKIGRAHV